jgi:hypothetical protein
MAQLLALDSVLPTAEADRSGSRRCLLGIGSQRALVRGVVVLTAPKCGQVGAFGGQDCR